MPWQSYLISYILTLPCRAFSIAEIYTTFFRATNLIGAVLLLWVLSSVLCLLAKTNYEGHVTSKQESEASWSPAELVHVAINICLFPPLFFFYGLYYTDILSALSVLVAYRCYLSNEYEAITVGAGLLSLLFRQTNIFWVSVFLGGLAVCRAMPKGRPNIEFSDGQTIYEIIQASWRHAAAYDPPISEAFFEGC